MSSHTSLNPFAGLKIPSVAEIAAVLNAEEERRTKLTPSERAREDMMREMISRTDHIQPIGKNNTPPTDTEKKLYRDIANRMGDVNVVFNRRA